MKTVKTYAAVIYAGFRVGRSTDHSDRTHTLADAIAITQAWVDKTGACVTVNPTRFVYTNGGEEGVTVGLINYPRFPSDFQTIRAKALELGELLRVGLEQYRVSIVFPDDTVMLSALDAEARP
jgi:hypothetical protein